MTGTLAVVAGLARSVGILRAHTRWMGINLALALVPLVLAVALFRGRRARGPVWWAGALAFMVFLPNAPYVLTDVIHLGGDVRAAGSRHVAMFAVLPLYALLILVGMESYTLSLRLLREYLERTRLAPVDTAVVAGVHLLCAVGVVLGRRQRLNSWDVLRPSRMVSGLSGTLAHPALIVATAVVVAAGTMSLDRATLVLRRLLGRRGGRH